MGKITFEIANNLNRDRRTIKKEFANIEMISRMINNFLNATKGNIKSLISTKRGLTSKNIFEEAVFLRM